MAYASCRPRGDAQHAVKEHTYDAFVVHAPSDEWFVRGYLLPHAGLTAERVLVLSSLELGELITTEIERGVRRSRVTIVVLSAAFVDDHLAGFTEQVAAHARMCDQAPQVVLPLLLDDCALPARIHALVKLDFRCRAPHVWQAEIERLRGYLARPAPAALVLPCPYPGMRPLTGEDGTRLFGRELELDRILRRLARGEREICVVGASGSGKTSLIVAGLLPRLARGVDGLPPCHVEMLAPGSHPLEPLGAALGDLRDAAAAVSRLLARHAPARSLVLVVDPLEDLLEIGDEAQRRAWCVALRALRADPRCVLILGVRADRYSAFVDSPLWSEREGGIGRVVLGPLSEASVRLAIERPARELEVYVQPALVARLVDDVAGEPGGLSLLQEALRLLWSRRSARLITLADYHALDDGVRTGLAFVVNEHAACVLDTLTESERAIALRIVLRLVSFGDGRADTRRQQPRDALRSEGEHGFERVLQRLADSRLVTVGADARGAVQVDLSHEIMIGAWSTLVTWIRSWRADEQTRRALEAAAAAWSARGRGEGGLLDAVELADAIAWRRRAAEVLGHSTTVGALLTASCAAHARASLRPSRDAAAAPRLSRCQERRPRTTGPHARAASPSGRR